MLSIRWSKARGGVNVFVDVDVTVSVGRRGTCWIGVEVGKGRPG